MSDPVPAMRSWPEASLPGTLHRPSLFDPDKGSSAELINQETWKLILLEIFVTGHDLY